MSIFNVLKKSSIVAAGTGLFALGTVGLEANAATIGADAFGYSATDEIDFIFEDISTTGTRVLAGVDDSTATTSLGFNFNFYGTNYNNVFWNSNGLITFGNGTWMYGNSDLTTSSSVNLPSIAAFWDDLQFFNSGTDAVYYQTLGSPGKQRFIVQWNQAGGYYSSPSPVTFQAVLFEGTNDILLSYLDVDSEDGRAFGGSATVGIADSNGYSNGKNLQWSYNSAILRNNQSICVSTDGCRSVVSTPEPASLLALLAFGALGAGSAFKKRKSQD
ncbi:MAG: PEP-CTERM sorting domain-containing protein [Hydrococcus sp. Prado102]|jgi:hypothetical protein|nr:PEP-CTERM sorting domain-containing protein [Hydrococcus sp. Prado102]